MVVSSVNEVNNVSGALSNSVTFQLERFTSSNDLMTACKFYVEHFYICTIA